MVRSAEREMKRKKEASLFWNTFNAYILYKRAKFYIQKNPSAIMFCMHNVIETENIKDTTDEI